MKYDKEIEVKINDLCSLVKDKRDSYPPGSNEKKQYRKLSKKLDDIMRSDKNEEEN